MEIAKAELAALEKATVENTEGALTELADLQLMLVGGGVGDIILG